MANRKKKQQVKLVNKNGGTSFFTLQHADLIFEYQKQNKRKTWEIALDSDYEYHDEDGIIKRDSNKNN